MKEYLLLFRNTSGENGYLASPEDMAEDMPIWQSWLGTIAQEGRLISTAPIEYKSKIVTTNNLAEGPHKEKNNVLVSGYVICKSESIEEVAEWSKSCPILKYPNSSVEIRPLLPFPTDGAK